MPTATPFTALGRGNGFPSCLAKLDVTSEVFSETDGTAGAADHWITLGGVSSGTASQSQINLSLRNAMKLFYNTYSIAAGNLSASSEGSGDFVSSQSTEVDANNVAAIYKKYTTNLITNEGGTAYLPKERACPNPEITASLMYFTDREEGDDRLGRLNFSQVSLIARSSGIVRMYNGSTDDDSNFVGYGISNLAQITASSRLSLGLGAGEISTSASVKVSSFFRGENQSGLDPDTGEETEIKFQNCTLGGISFKSMVNCRSKGRVSTSAHSEEIEDSAEVTSALSGTASTTLSATFGSEGSQSSQGETACEASISSLNFYTY